MASPVSQAWKKTDLSRTPRAEGNTSLSSLAEGQLQKVCPQSAEAAGPGPADTRGTLAIKSCCGDG